MFFTGLFSTHIPYIILIGVYSISFGIYSVYYITSKTQSRNIPVKKIDYTENGEFTGSKFHFQDYTSHEKDYENSNISLPPNLKLKPLLKIKQIVFSASGKFTRDTVFSLFSRPPPAH